MSPSFELSIPELFIVEGAITGFIGENGAGKTTTIKLIMNMLFPDKGEIKVFSLDSIRDSAKIKEDIGYVGEQPGFFEYARLSTIKRLVSSLYINWDNALFDEYMERYAISEKRRYTELSKGLKKIFSVVLCLCHHPKLIVLDEATANLDPYIRNDVLDILDERSQNEGVSVFLSTHITQDLDRAASDIVFLHEGSVLLNRSKTSLLDGCYVVKGLASALEAQNSSVLENMRTTPFGFSALTHSEARAKELFLEKADIAPASLDDIFIHYTRGKQSE